MTNGKILIQIDRAYDGCLWIWDIWIDGELCRRGGEDTVEDAMDAVLECLRGDAE